MALYTKKTCDTDVYEATVTIYVLSGDTISVGELQLGSRNIFRINVEIARSRTTLKIHLRVLGPGNKVSLK